MKYCTKWTLFKATALTPLAKSHSANCTLFRWMPTALLFLFRWMPTALLLNLNTPGILRGPILLPFLPNAFTSLSNLAFCIISLHWQSRDLFAWNAWKQCILYNIQCTQYPWHLKSFCWWDLRHQAGNCQTRETFPRPSCSKPPDIERCQEGPFVMLQIHKKKVTTLQASRKVTTFPIVILLKASWYWEVWRKDFCNIKNS